MTRSTLLISCVLSCTFLLLGLARHQADPGPAPGEVPIGTILVWWGKAADVPAGYEVCDGTTVTTAGAILRGRKPDLRNRFVRGTSDHRGFVPLAFVGGGVERVETETASVQITIDSADITLAANQLPAHNHGIARMPHRIVTADSGNGMGPLVDASKPSAVTHQHAVALPTAANFTSGGSDPHVVPGGATPSAITTGSWPPAGDALVESHPATTTVAPLLGGTPQAAISSQAVITHTHTANAGTITLNERENRPPFLDVIFILRVK